MTSLASANPSVSAPSAPLISSLRLPRRASRIVRGVFATGVLALFAFGEPETSRAEGPPAISGFAPIGQVLLDKSGCASCPAVFATTRRHRTCSSPRASAAARSR